MGDTKEKGRGGFVLESDGLLDLTTKIHCTVCREMDTGEVKAFGPDDIRSALYLLTNAKEVMDQILLGTIYRLSRRSTPTSRYRVK